MYHDERDKTPLCCCEYYNIDQERSHILLCCCNCEALDNTVDRFINGQFAARDTTHPLMSTLQDRLRIPWRGGAKQISLDALLPVVLHPILLYICAQNIWCTIFVIACTSFSLHCAHKTFLHSLPRTKFFILWFLMSVLTIILVFEVNVVPLLEILPEENYILVGIASLALFLAYRIYSKASHGHVVRSDIMENGFMLSGENTSDGSCSICHRKVPPRTYHCRICQACIIKRDRHCAWLDCCISDKNRGLYLACILTSIGALVYAAVLTLTTVCHPFMFMELVLLPDDCSDVYHDLQIAVCFVIAVVCFVYALFLFLLFLEELFLISVGLTKHEWTLNNQSCCCWSSTSPYNRGLFKNWSTFLFNR